MNWQKKYAIASLVTLVPAVFLVSEDVQGARMVFAALSWTSTVYLLTLILIPGHNAARNAVRGTVLLLLAPLALIFIFAGGDGLMSWFRSDAANQSAFAVQSCYQELAKIPSVIKAMVVSGDLRQFNGTFRWFFLILGLSFVLAVLKFFMSLLKNATKRKDRELEAT